MQRLENRIEHRSWCLVFGFGEGQLGADCAPQCLEEPALSALILSREIEIEFYFNFGVALGFI